MPEDRFDKFGFGVAWNSPLRISEQVSLPRCSKATVQIIMTEAKIDLPQVVNIKFNNGIEQEVVNVSGRYQLWLAGQPEISSNIELMKC